MRLIVVAVMIATVVVETQVVVIVRVEWELFYRICIIKSINIINILTSEEIRWITICCDDVAECTIARITSCASYRRPIYVASF